MKCVDMKGLLALYADDSLEGQDASRVRKHLDVCAFCREELAYLQASLGLLHGQADPPLPPGLHQHIMAGIREEKRRRAKAAPGFWLRFPRSMAAVAAVFLMFLVGGNFYMIKGSMGSMPMSSDYGVMDSQELTEDALAARHDEKEAGTPEEAMAAPQVRQENQTRNIALYNAVLLTLGGGGLWYYYRRKNKYPQKTGD